MAFLSYSNGSAILQRVLRKRANRVTQATETRSLLSILRKPYLVQFTVFLVAYGIAGKVGQATTNIRSSNLGPVWPAYGIALAAFLVCGYRIWPAIALGSFSIAFFSPVSHLAALGQSAGATLAAFSGAFLLQHVAKFDTSLSRLRDALALIVLGALGSALVSASIGTSVLYATEVHAYSGLGSAWLIYWLGDATGVLLVTPLVLTIPNVLRSQHHTRITELAVLFVLLTAACFLIFGDPGLIPVRLHVLAFAVLPFCNVGSDPFRSYGSRVVGSLDCHNCDRRDSVGVRPFRHQHSLHKRCSARCVLCRSFSDGYYFGLGNCRKGASAARARAGCSRAGRAGGTARGRARTTCQRGTATIGTAGGWHWNV